MSYSAHYISSPTKFQASEACTMRYLSLTLAACTLPFSMIPAAAQTSSPVQMQTVPPPPRPPLPGTLATHPEWPVAKSTTDVDTVDHIMVSLYDVISGPAGQQRDWDRFRSLFLPEGRLGVVRAETAATEGRPATRGDIAFLTPEAYIARQDGAFKAAGFFERSIANHVEEFGNLVHVWSSYESRRTANDTKPFARGINSVQLVHAQGRYWIASIVWDAERPGLVIPDRYLAKP
jgi:hypothetical protein